MAMFGTSWRVGGSPASRFAAPGWFRSRPVADATRRLDPPLLALKGGSTMAKLIYTAITSLDGYVADEDGDFDWAAPDEEVLTFVNDLERPVGTYLYGRRMYVVMAPWETLADQQPVMRDYAQIWQAADKIVYSKTLDTVASARTRIEREFDREAVRQLKAKQDVTSAWAVPISPPRPSRPGWSTSAACSSRPSWWAAATGPSPTRSA